MKAKHTLATFVLTCTGAALLTGATLLADGSESAHRGGTDILHLLLREKFQNQGVETNGSGWLELEQNQQGHADHQSLELLLDGLQTNTPYFLLAATTTNTNSAVVSQFDTDARGRALVAYRSSATGHDPVHGPGNQPLPEALSPVSALRFLAVANASTQAVLSADLHSPGALDYLLKRNLTNGDVWATLWIKTDHNGGDIRLLARGLTPNTNYFLAFNGGIAQTNSTDAQGRLAAGAELVSPSDILELNTVSVLDASSNVVVSTQVF